AVMIDEADAFLGNRDASGDSGTSSRVFASIASFMGNTEYRGKIIWFLLTCRPDLLPIDLKRQGRAEEHIALFYPQDGEEVDARFYRQARERVDELIRVMAKKTRIEDPAHEPISARFTEQMKSHSGADMEAILVRAKFRALAAGHEKVTEQVLADVLEDFVQPSYPLEVELQNLVAVQECTSRSLLPEQYRGMERDAISRRVQELKVLLEER